MSYHELIESEDIGDRDYFLTFVPNTEEYLEYNIDPVPLKVIRGNGIQVTPLTNMVETSLRTPDEDGVRRKFFTNHGYEGIRFKIDVVLDVEDNANIYTYTKEIIPDTNGATHGIYEYSDAKVMDVLDYVIVNAIPVNIVTWAVDIPNGLYLITKNDSRKQTQDKKSIWSLEFTTFHNFTVTQYMNDNSKVLNAITQATAARKAYAAKVKAQAKKTTTTTTTKKTATSLSANSQKLQKCGVSNLKYSSKQKDVTCVRYLQKALKNLKYYTRQIDGWYGKYTKQGVKNFQSKYKKTYGLKVNGVMDTKTLNAIIKKDTKK